MNPLTQKEQLLAAQEIVRHIFRTAKIGEQLVDVERNYGVQVRFNIVPAAESVEQNTAQAETQSVSPLEAEPS